MVGGLGLPSLEKRENLGEELTWDCAECHGGGNPCAWQVVRAPGPFGKDKAGNTQRVVIGKARCKSCKDSPKRVLSKTVFGALRILGEF